MAASAQELRIAEALHTLVDEFLAPTLAAMASPEKQLEIRQAELTVPQVAKILKIHPRTVKRLIDRSELIAKKVGSQWRVDPVDLDRYKLSQDRK